MMLSTEKVKPQVLAYWFVLMLVFIIPGRYGTEAIEWVITKLYDFFIIRKPLLF